MFALFAPKLVLELDGTDFHLALPQKSDFKAWVDARRTSYDHLQPFEPSWSMSALSKSAYKIFVKQSHSDFRKGRGVSLVLKRNATGVVIGGVSLRNVRRSASQSATLGYWMAKEYSGEGRMKQAVRSIVAYGFDALNLHRIEAACLPGNQASISVLTTNGFCEEGISNSYLRIDGEWRDHIRLALVNPHWQA